MQDATGVRRLHGTLLDALPVSSCRGLQESFVQQLVSATGGGGHRLGPVPRDAGSPYDKTGGYGVTAELSR